MSHRHDAWGDDPEERDADETVAELVAETEAARRWHDHPAVVPAKAVVLFISRNGRRVGVSIAGILLILVGLVGLALPILPGWLLIFAGFAVLSTEYVWAERMLRRASNHSLRARSPSFPGSKNTRSSVTKSSFTSLTTVTSYRSCKLRPTPGRSTRSLPNPTGLRMTLPEASRH